MSDAVKDEQAMNRRDFLTTSAAALLMPLPLRAATGEIRLRPAPVSQQILPTEYAGPTKLLGFNGGVPGPEIRAAQGERVRVLLDNGLDEGAAVHWHGVRLANAMDGVPMMTQDLVDPGATFLYDFVPPDAGTYWYHSHYLSLEQVGRGLMGPLIVTEAAPPDVDHDITAMMADYKLDPEGQLTDDFANPHDVSHDGRMGNFARAFLPDVTLRTGERIRLRLVNGSVDRVIPVLLQGLEGKIVALDGMPLATPRAIDVPLLAPAQRVDIIADVTGPVRLEMEHRMGPYPLGELAVDGEVTPRDTPVAALPANPVPTPGPVTQDLTLTLQGGMMAPRHTGDNVWAVNGVSDMQPDPFARFARGETARITLVNDTAFPHGIHLHGHHFHELGPDGTPGDLRDTTLVERGESRSILCTFDNPGHWMVHCHMLSHQVGGMMTWVEVA